MGTRLLMASQHGFEDGFECFLDGFPADALAKLKRSNVGCEPVF
jgi:hypothetical protein